jgi:hypothetical protein
MFSFLSWPNLSRLDNTPRWDIDINGGVVPQACPGADLDTQVDGRAHAHQSPGANGHLTGQDGAR